MDQVGLANFAAGYGVESGPIEAWRVDRFLAEALGVKPGTAVLLSYSNYLKIGLKHKEIDHARLSRFVDAVTSSQTVVARHDRRSAVIVCMDPALRCKIVLRRTYRGEVFVVTMHGIDRGEAKRLRRKADREGRIVRDVETKPARSEKPRRS